MINIYWSFITGFCVGFEFIENYDEAGNKGLLINLGIVDVLIEY
jgi:hypothetical protein